jgi:hypothetical protein
MLGLRINDFKRGNSQSGTADDRNLLWDGRIGVGPDTWDGVSGPALRHHAGRGYCSVMRERREKGFKPEAKPSLSGFTFIVQAPDVRRQLRHKEQVPPTARAAMPRICRFILGARLNSWQASD